MRSALLFGILFVFSSPSVSILGISNSYPHQPPKRELPTATKRRKLPGERPKLPYGFAFAMEQQAGNNLESARANIIYHYAWSAFARRLGSDNENRARFYAPRGSETGRREP